MAKMHPTSHGSTVGSSQHHHLQAFSVQRYALGHLIAVYLVHGNWTDLYWGTTLLPPPVHEVP